MMNNEQHKQTRNALMMAALDCGHTIDSDCITLQCDPAKPGNALAQLSGRLLDAYLAAACASAEPVEPLSVVEPQVAADECAAFEVWAKAEGLAQESHGIRSTSSMCDVARKAWKAGRAALAAAPVQAQEPVATFDMEVIDSFIGRITGSFGAAMDSAYCPSSDAFKAARKRFYAAAEEFRNVLALSAFPSQVQPVIMAVPDGDALVNAMCKAGLANDHGRRTLLNGEEIGFDLLSLMAIVRIAAPAAQGDATEARTLQIGTATHLTGEQIFSLATPYFLWTKDGAACGGSGHAGDVPAGSAP